jgi:hypothetical protein
LDFIAGEMKYPHRILLVKRLGKRQLRRLRRRCGVRMEVG